jgi:O2-independent ubiquinone biosynthesis accessory factor UbiT
LFEKENTMSQSRYLLPPPVGKLLSRLPLYPGSLLFVAALNLVVNPRLPADVRQLLAGRKLRIAVSDAGLRFDFHWLNGRFSACAEASAPELAIIASAHDFLQLIRREEDPDTLFFSRRLVMEGDTELGLLVKNTLDAIDIPLPALDRIVPAGLRARLRAMSAPPP